MPTQSLHDRLRALRFEHRLDQARLIEKHTECDERTKAAVAIIREIAMQRVFDRLTKEQETGLLDILWPLAHPDGTRRPAIFSDGAKDRLDTRQTDLSR